MLNRRKNEKISCYARDGYNSIMTSTIDSFINQSRITESVEGLFSLYQSLLAEFNFDRVCYVITSNQPELSSDHELGVIYSNNMSAWVKHYAENNYLAVDPLHQMGLLNPGVIVWADIIQQSKFSQKELSVFQAAKEFGLHNGQTVFLHGFNGTKMAILMASSHSKAIQHQHAIDAIWLASHQFHRCYLDIMKYRLKVTDKTLTPKEKEVLKWMSQGLTKLEVGDKLAMSSHTVDYHIRKILKKLDAKNTVAATAIAIKYNFINF